MNPTEELYCGAIAMVVALVVMFFQGVVIDPMMVLASALGIAMGVGILNFVAKRSR